MGINNIIDWLGKSLSRIKTVALVVVIIMFGLSMLKSGCDRARMENMVERITGLNVRNDILMEDVKERDSVLIVKDLRIQALKDSLIKSEHKSNELETVYGLLKKKYDNLAEDLLKAPVDASYRFLVDEAYPYPGHLKFPFNEPQVKGIHLTYLQKQSLEDQNGNLLAQLGEKDHQLSLKDSVVYEQTDQMMLMKASRQDMEQMVANQDTIIQVQEKQITKCKRKRTFLEIVGGAIIVALTAIAVGGG
jgi:hypothetical protein